MAKFDPYLTETKFNQDAVTSVMKGVNEVAEAIATSLGPKGRNVVIDLGYQLLVINDGVKIGTSITPEDRFARAGAKIIKEACKKQRDEVGDGTSVVAILALAILNESLKAIASGVNPAEFRKGIESGAKKVIAEIEKLSQPITSLSQMKQVASISAKDEELGSLIAETVEKVGKEGIITIDESKLPETKVEIQEGMQLDRGYAHWMMMTNTDKELAIFDDCHVLVTDYDLVNMSDLGKFLNDVIVPNTKKVVFFAPDFGGDFLPRLLEAKLGNRFWGLGVKVPRTGKHRTNIMLDICAITGATFVSKEAGHKFNELSFDVLGKAEQIKSSKYSTVIAGGSGHRQDVLTRIAQIKKQMEDPDNTEFDREQLRERLGKLTNGIAVIKVGGQTEVEMKERKERADDAVHATQAAVRHGIVPGGEISYLIASKYVDWDATSLGEKILREALKQPFKRLVSNAGYDGGEMITELKYKKEGIGFDVMSEEFKPMVKAGIVDPVAVPIQAIKNAVSVEAKLSSLGAAVVLLEDEEIGKKFA